MRLLILLLFAIPTFAQKMVIITDEHNTPISGASVFLMGDKNRLISVSDEQGGIKIDLIDTANYLIHSLGFIDAKFSAGKLANQSFIVLKTASYQLKEVSARSSLTTFEIIQPKAREFTMLSDSPQDANIQRVNLIKIDTGGYLKFFKLFCKIQVKEVIPNYRFVLYSEKQGKPDSLILPLKVDGKISKREIIFDLSKSNYYLEKGSYYIGYETVDGKTIIKKQVFNHKNEGQFITTPILIFASDEKKISYHRQNLSKWAVPRMGNIVNGNIVWKDSLSQNFAYELHLMH